MPVRGFANTERSPLYAIAHPVVNPRPNSYAPPVDMQPVSRLGFLSLPNELVFLILKDITEEGLLQLALSCRRIHFCAIHLYLSRYGFEDPTFLPSVTLSRQSPNVFPALRTSLFMTAIGNLRYRFSFNGFRSEIRQLARLLPKLTRLEQLTLDFTNTNYWALSYPAKEQAIRFFRKWIQILEDIFETALGKSCTAVKVFGGRLYPLASESYGIVGWPGWDAALWRESKPCDKHSPNSPLVSMFYNGLDPLREALGLSSIGHKAHQSHSTLKLFHVHDPLLLHPALSFWTIQTINTSSITDLSFMYLNLPSTRWGKILPRITVPTLSRLSLAHCNISGVALSKFLSRHRQVITLRLGEGLPTVYDFSPCRKAAFRQLTALTAPIDYVFQLLSPSDSLPRLRFLSVCASLNILRLFSTHGRYRSLSVLLASVAARGLLLSMTLVLPTGGDHWLDLLMNEGYISVNHMLHGITHLVIWADPTFLSARLITQFPIWLASFPLLQHITFMGKTESWEIGKNTMALIRSIHAKCAGVQSVNLSDVEHHVSTWLAMHV